MACDSNNNGQTSGRPAVRPMRNTISAEAITSQAVSGSLKIHRPWVKKHPISITTETAHNNPIVDFS